METKSSYWPNSYHFYGENLKFKIQYSTKYIGPNFMTKMATLPGKHTNSIIKKMEIVIKIAIIQIIKIE